MSSAVVISASYDKQIRLWDAASGRTVRSFTFQESQINSLFLMPESGYLAVAGFGVLRLYDLATYMHSGNTGAAAAGQAGGAANANQAPPVYSSFESQSSMNFTSLAAVPLVRTVSDDQSSTYSSSSRQLTESGSSVLNEQLLGTVVISDLGGILGPGFKEVSSLLIATSEDGHIRFFDSNSATTLRILKDIATGAAITCSAVSPDRRYLLTGNQMGQVSMWHLPSIVASVAMEMKKNSASSKNNANRSNPAQPAGGGGDEAAADPEAEREKAKEKENMDVLKAFGRHAIHEINFGNDYSAIRSIAIEPLGRWAAVATNAGKVHFIRLARNQSVGGSKAGLGPHPSAARAAGANNNSADQGTPRDVQRPRPLSGGSTPQMTPQKSATNSVVDSQSGANSSRLALTGKVGSYAESGGLGGGGGSTGPTSYHGPRESIYRSALVVNELSANARRVSGASDESPGVEVSLHATRNGGGSVHNSIGAVLLDHLEQQQSTMNSRSNHTTPQLTLGQTVQQHELAQQSAAMRLADEFEMEVFDTIQAHYKYILRVLISPSAELLMTCSADYSIGRFVIPPALHRPASPSASASAAKAAAESARQGSESAPRKAAEEDEARREATFSPSFASTQAPSKNSPGEPAVNAAATAADAGKAKAAAAAAADSHSANSLGQSFDAAAKGAVEDNASAELSMEFKPLKPLSGHQRWVWDGAFSDCSNFLFTASSDNTVRMWNGLSTERPQSVSFVGHTKPVVAVLLCYDRRRLGSGSPLPT